MKKSFFVSLKGGLMDIQDQITSAIAAHGTWKIRLETAIEKGTGDLSPTNVQSDDGCAFGKWLRDSAAAPIKASPHYAKCRELHRQFHVVAAKILTLAMNGNKTEAIHAIDLRDELTHVSSALAHAMIEWKERDLNSH
jgi:hypothetical protein